MLGKLPDGIWVNVDRVVRVWLAPAGGTVHVEWLDAENGPAEEFHSVPEGVDGQEYADWVASQLNSGDVIDPPQPPSDRSPVTIL